MLFLVVLLALLNILSFALYGSDKVRARRREERVPERVLLGIAFAGGAFGAGLAMCMFRHKTRHVRFVLLVPLFLLAQLYLLCLLIG